MCLIGVDYAEIRRPRKPSPNRELLINCSNLARDEVKCTIGERTGGGGMEVSEESSDSNGVPIFVMPENKFGVERKRTWLFGI
jgi:hypothetical protein